MPLIKSGSKKAVSTNIAEMVRAGYPQKQAVAASLSNARKYAKRADGGSVTEDEITAQMARRAAAERTRNAAVKRFADGGHVSPYRLTYPPATSKTRSESTEHERALRTLRRNPPVTIMEDLIGGLSPSKGQSNALRDAIREGAGEAMRAAGPYIKDRGIEYATGGAPNSSWFQRSQARDVARSGMLKSPIPGRTDKLPIGVGSGSYVLPADTVSALGQGNSEAGAAVLDKMFKSGPYGVRPMQSRARPRMSAMRPVRMPRADGGAANNVDIIAAGGEYILEPEEVANIGDGDMARGHSILDSFVKNVRAQTIKDLRKLPGPKRS